MIHGCLTDKLISRGIAFLPCSLCVESSDTRHQDSQKEADQAFLELLHIPMHSHYDNAWGRMDLMIGWPKRSTWFPEVVKRQLAGNPLYSLNLFKHNKHGLTCRSLKPMRRCRRCADVADDRNWLGWTGHQFRLWIPARCLASTWEVSNAFCVKGHGSASLYP